MNPADAEALSLSDNDLAVIAFNGSAFRLAIRLEDVPPSVVLLPRSMGVPIEAPVRVRIEAAELIPA
jgi:hypothetical protein